MTVSRASIAAFVLVFLAVGRGGAADVSKNAVGAERFFAGKSWYTPVGSEYRFTRDGGGYRIDSKKVKTPLTWRKLENGIVEVSGTLAPGAPVQKWFFKFDNNRTALMGDKADKLEWVCHDTK